MKYKKRRNSFTACGRNKDITSGRNDNKVAGALQAD